MQVMPGSSWRVVEEAKDLNPFRVRLFRYNERLLGQTSGKAARPDYGAGDPRSESGKRVAPVAASAR
ncbi:hypothetical protein GCM10009843_05960 [Nocardioides bigeumensis]|uniref:Transposase n=1 Tax=Nocardioides bigeumensis TaxID=433657 RepID=A0ABN2XR04_9ACTN